MIPPKTILDAEICKRDFFYFIKEFWDVVIPEDPVYNWHIEYLCTQLQKVVERVERREDKEKDIIINIPPGTSKSTICTVMLPAWSWTIDPTLRILTASYSSSLATDHAIKSRDIIKSKKYKELFPDVRIKRDQDNKTHYKNEKGGERYATSVTGTATGFHAHIIIVDDPLNPMQAVSDVERDKANSFMDVTLSTRKVSKTVTPTILVMQRLHTDDPTGNWLSKKEVEHYCLPGEISKEVKPECLKENYTDGLLDPIRLDRKALDELKINLGSYGYAGQIGQTPSPLDGGIWKKWFIPVPDKEFPKELTQYGTDWDLAYTKDDKNSASAYVTAGKLGNDMYIDFLGFDWLEFPALIEFMKTKPATHYIEGKASGKSAKQSLISQGINAVEVSVQGGDKIARATMATPYAESGRVFVRESQLNTLYFDQKQGILVFPNGSNDDLQDALTQSINRLLGSKTINYGRKRRPRNISAAR